MNVTCFCCYNRNATKQNFVVFCTMTIKPLLLFATYHWHWQWSDGQLMDLLHWLCKLAHWLKWLRISSTDVTPQLQCKISKSILFRFGSAVCSCVCNLLCEVCNTVELWCATWLVVAYKHENWGEAELVCQTMGTWHTLYYCYPCYKKVSVCYIVVKGQK